jgi:hypothetical protein
VTIVRRGHRTHFIILPNAVFVDQRVSVEAKGVLGYLLSRPHKWHGRLEHVGRPSWLAVKSCSASSVHDCHRFVCRVVAAKLLQSVLECALGETMLTTPAITRSAAATCITLLQDRHAYLGRLARTTRS